jgi:NAD-dependent dihydropyrimidine dehydrogenase PreA subunit
MALTPPAIRVVLYEGPGAVPVDGAMCLDAVRGLLEQGWAVTRAGVGCPLPPQEHGAVVVVGRADQPPAAFGAAAVGGANLHWHPLGNDPAALPQAVLAQVASDGSPTSAPWNPWFPVIDYDRCTQCLQCLSFCLFGVYGIDADHRIQVQNPEACKTLCPACSRVCPEAAIMFPKYQAGPINGDAVSEADLQREKMKVDLSSMLGGDVYALLRDRGERTRNRFDKERNADQALSERRKCLCQLGELAAAIPPEVLRQLPSPEEIARKAAEAAARAATARGRTAGS